MAKLKTISFVIDFLLVIAIAVALVVTIMAYERGSYCQQSQSEVCPQLYCNTASDECGDLAFRVNGDDQMCQSEPA